MKKLFVIIDNGHGRETSGKKSPDGRLEEWRWARNFAYFLAQALTSVGISSCYLVPEDNDVSLTERVKRVNNIYKHVKENGCECVLISLHVNAAGSDGKWYNAQGFTSWVYTKAGKASRALAHIFGQKAEAMGLKRNRVYDKNKYFEANFKILRETACPAVLCENMFMDNIDDVEFLLSKEGQDQLIELYKNSILLYESTLIEN